MDIVSEFLNCKNFAVVGSFKDESKVAYRIVRSLLRHGYNVFPVNPNAKEVAGLSVYPSVAALPPGVEVVDLVTPPAATEKIVRDCLDLGLTRVWMQPGAESPAAIVFCKDNGIQVIDHDCVMMHLH